AKAIQKAFKDTLRLTTCKDDERIGLFEQEMNRRLNLLPNSKRLQEIPFELIYSETAEEEEEAYNSGSYNSGSSGTSPSTSL
ncbi:MAG: hypothetical protein QNK11_02245, partial [Legionella sp.]|nr:hypothetical protein [Legionella sp.]